MQNLFIIIQARMTSTRLPAKVMLRLCETSVLGVMLERLDNFKNNIIIATTNDGTQAPIVALCEKLNIKYYEGDTQNVLSRYYEAALKFGVKENDIIVRCTSDCPLIDKDIVQSTINYFISSGADYTSAGAHSGFPRGMDTEVFRFSLLKEAYKNAHSEYEKEHVTPYMHITKRDKLYITQYKNKNDDSDYRLTLDEEDDYKAIKEVYKLFNNQTDFSYATLIQTLHENPYIHAINEHVEQKKSKILNAKKNILFRADSSSAIGIGHIMRDLVLAKKFNDANITFAVLALEGNINYKITNSGYNLKILNSNDKKELAEIIKTLYIDLLVIDHNEIDYKYEKFIKNETGVEILSFDDIYKKHYCDILLNHNISADPKKYKDLVPKKCELRCGEKYTLLRDEFILEKRKRVKQQKSKTRIFLAIGGTDHSNINIKILEVLQNYTNIRVDVVTTTSNKNLKDLMKYVKYREWIKLHIESQNIAKLMRKSDLAIVTPSVTLNEVYFMQIPFIAIKTADNQDEMYKYLKKNKYEVLKKFTVKKLISALDRQLT